MTAAPPRLVLASKSESRSALLRAAGIDFDTASAGIDERAAEAPLLAAGAGPAAVAGRLAEAKAIAVSLRRPDDVVIGADQTLDLAGELFVKADDRSAARRQLVRLAGRTHLLHAAVAVAIGGAVLWRHVSVARMSMRRLDAAAVDRYLDEAGDGVLGSVGCYHLEGVGVRLFEAIEGDYFAVLGLPLLPLFAFLRDQGLIDR